MKLADSLLICESVLLENEKSQSKNSSKIKIKQLLEIESNNNICQQSTSCDYGGSSSDRQIDRQIIFIYPRYKIRQLYYYFWKEFIAYFFKERSNTLVPSLWCQTQQTLSTNMEENRKKERKVELFPYRLFNLISTGAFIRLTLSPQDGF